MQEGGAALEVLAMLATSLLLVSLTLRLGLGAIPGYIAAGFLVGPEGLGVVTEYRLVEAVSEFGVLFLLFAIGLELPPARLRAIGLRSFQLGFFQLVVTGMLGAAIADLATGSPTASLAIGFGLAFSSTAIGLRLLTERSELTTRMGRSAFAILMVQDLAVGPLLILITALAGSGADTLLSLLAFLVRAGLFVAGSLLAGHFLLGRLYDRVARLHADELLVALHLLIAIGMAAGARLAELSPAIGGLLAGMVLADSPYRHRIATDIRPFRGLLVGLFFVAVGMRLDPWLDLSLWLAILGGTLLLVAGKTLILALLARLWRLEWQTSLRLGLVLSQAGEFAYVLWSEPRIIAFLDPSALRPLTLAVVLSMAVTPLLLRLADRMLPKPGAAGIPHADELLERPDRSAAHVVIAGAGPVGMRIASVLLEAGVPLIGLDASPDRVRRARHRGLPFFFGDVCQPDILEDVGLDEARAVLLVDDDRDRMERATALIRYLFPQVPVLVRVPEEEDCERFRSLGATVVIPEIVSTGKALADATLRLLADDPGGPD